VLDIIHKYDVLLLSIINELGNTFSDPFWLFVTKIYVWFPFFIILFYAAFKNNKKATILTILIFGIILLAVVLGLTELVKNFTARVRPINNPLLEGVFREVIHPTNYSFYSGHAASSVAIATYFITILKDSFKPILILILWSTLFTYSRLYFAVHYPSDILVGALIGFIVARVFVSFVKKRLLENSTNC
jgi:undecaprenyl-diphosphatase